MHNFFDFIEFCESSVMWYPNGHIKIPSTLWNLLQTWPFSWKLHLVWQDHVITMLLIFRSVLNCLLMPIYTPSPVIVAVPMPKLTSIPNKLFISYSFLITQEQSGYHFDLIFPFCFFSIIICGLFMGMPKVSCIKKIENKLWTNHKHILCANEGV